MYRKLISTEELLKRELNHDRIQCDVTSAALFEKEDPAALAVIRAKEPGVFFGETLGAALERVMNGSISVACNLKDGDEFVENALLVHLRGKASDCLAVERTLLNILSHLCGISSITREYVKAVGKNKAKILHTRKTLPGLRELQLGAVRAGGGMVHRRSLADGILIKDNHLAFVSEVEAIKRAKAYHSPLHRVEIELDSLEKLDAVLAAGPDLIMLDNLRGPELKNAIQRINGKCLVEVSGRISLEEVSEIAGYGADYISVGKLTHSVRSIDLSMEMQRDPAEA